jgi:hypothetical protein
MYDYLMFGWFFWGQRVQEDGSPLQHEVRVVQNHRLNQSEMDTP